MSASWQPSLLGSAGEPAVDRSFTGLTRHELDATSWVDLVPGWVSSADALFEELSDIAPWGSRTRWMYDRVVAEPRLTARWPGEDDWEPPGVLLDALAALTEHYGRPFSTIGFNLYRDGRDSVAWHGDRIPKEIVDPAVALVSLGAPRRFLLRPKGGGPSVRFTPGSGDLLVTGGASQRRWQHSVPKVKEAGPRISVAFRHN